MALIKTNARSASALDATILTGNLPALNGSAVTTINASNISSGTLAAASYSGGKIGTKGAGRSTGPHGHWEIRKNKQLLDPMSKDERGILLDQFFAYGDN